ncbi:cytochrome P450 [Penicillium frequentans]|uniref:Cytochrome P450 n=1 Tax=Penicillium frequentans TaxID=3151616 RepID=A0AAD6CKT1_9EURO|nr:cytochrome P450 [Penicillium glabrum]
MGISIWQFAHIAVAGGTYALVHHGPQEGFFARAGYMGCFPILYSAFLFALVVYSRILTPLWLSPLTKLPQPKGGSWWNGHFMNIYRSGTGEVERKWIHEIPNDGLIYYRSILNTTRVIVTAPKTIQEIVTRVDDFKKPVLARAVAGKILGEGLVLSELDKHRQQRRVFMPIFAPKHIREMYPIFWGKTCEVTRKLTQLVTNQSQQSSQINHAVFEVGHWSSRAALDIIGMATLGEDFGSVEKEDAPLASAYRKTIEPTRGHVALAMLKIWFPEWLVNMLPSQINRTLDESVPVFRNLCRNLLRERRQMAAEKNKWRQGPTQLYEDVAAADEEGVIDQMTTFLAAGHETISVGITWTLYMLCLHPEWQTILRKEARAHLPDPNANYAPDEEKQNPSATSADVEQMPMIQAFVNEVLRWYPPIPQTMREALEDTVIDGQVVPKGTLIIIPFKGLHRDTNFWGPDANKFNPRRWINADGTLSPNGGCVSKFVNLSFMQGQRSCIAQGFSKAEMACLLGAWIGRFKFELVDPTLLDEDKMPISIGSLSSKPLNGLDVKCSIVEGWRD